MLLRIGKYRSRIHKIIKRWKRFKISTIYSYLQGIRINSVEVGYPRNTWNSAKILNSLNVQSCWNVLDWHLAKNATLYSRKPVTNRPKHLQLLWVSVLFALKTSHRQMNWTLVPCLSCFGRMRGFRFEPKQDLYYKRFWRLTAIF